MVCSLPTRPLKNRVMRSFPTPLATLTAAAGFALPALAQDLPKVIDVDFATDVAPLISGTCVQCHNPEKMDKDGGGYDMTTKAATFKGGDAYGEDVIRAGDANDSPVYWMTTIHLDDPEDPEAMPPEKPLSEYQQQILFSWIQNGAEWPEGVVLEETPRVNYASVKPLLQRGGPFKPSELTRLRLWVAQGADWPAGEVATEAPSGPADDLELVKRIRETILEQSKETSESEMTDYATQEAYMRRLFTVLPPGQRASHARAAWPHLDEDVQALAIERIPGLIPPS